MFVKINSKKLRYGPLSVDNSAVNFLFFQIGRASCRERV